MDYLWSPWRYQYVSSASSIASSKDTCLFCRVAADTNDRENFIVLRSERCFVMLNRFPYTTGHLMIAPYAHVATLEDTDTAALEEIMRLAQRAETALRKTYRPAGMNLGFNIGESAGAGVAGHIHLHALPRWSGDTSFVTTIGETRVLPETLETTFEKLCSALKIA